MDKLKFNQYVRYILSGIAMPATFFILFPNSVELIEKYNKINNILIFIGFISFIGLITYGLHRVFFYPIFYKTNIFIFYTDIADNKRIKKLFFFFYKDERDKIKKKRNELDMKRLYERVNNKDIFESGGLNEWFSRIHFMYNTSLLIFITIILGAILIKKYELSYSGVLVSIFLGIIILCSAIFDDKRAMEIEKKLFYEEQHCKKMQETIISMDLRV